MNYLSSQEVDAINNATGRVIIDLDHGSSCVDVKCEGTGRGEIYAALNTLVMLISQTENLSDSEMLMKIAEMAYHSVGGKADSKEQSDVMKQIIGMMKGYEEETQ